MRSSGVKWGQVGSSEVKWGRCQVHVPGFGDRVKANLNLVWSMVAQLQDSKAFLGTAYAKVHYLIAILRNIKWSRGCAGVPRDALGMLRGCLWLLFEVILVSQISGQVHLGAFRDGSGNSWDAPEIPLASFRVHFAPA